MRFGRWNGRIDMANDAQYMMWGDNQPSLSQQHLHKEVGECVVNPLNRIPTAIPEHHFAEGIYEHMNTELELKEKPVPWCAVKYAVLHPPPSTPR